MDFELRLLGSKLGSVPVSAFYGDFAQRGGNWRRSIRDVGGFWEGSFIVEGDQEELREIFYNVLGAHVEEREGGDVTWEGFVSSMRFDAPSGVMVRDLQRMRNAFLAPHTVFSAENTENIIENGGFELLAPPDTYESWQDLAFDGGSISNTTSIVHSGSNAVQILTGTFQSTRIRQVVRVRQGKTYQFSFWTRGDGTNSGAWQLKDVASATNISPLSATGVSGTTWQRIVYDFVAPSSNVRIELWGSASLGGVAYFDDARLALYDDETVVPPFELCDESVEQFGRFEEILNTASRPFRRDAGNSNQGLVDLIQMREKNRLGWPNIRRVSLSGRRGNASLEIKCLGYIFTLNRRYATDVTLTEPTLSELIEYYVGTYGDNLIANEIRPNGVIITEPETNKRTWQTIQNLLEIGDGSGNQWKAWVDNGQKFNAAPISTEPRYFSRDGTLYDGVASGVEVSPRHARPGIWRDLSYAIPCQLSGETWLNDIRDAYVSEIIVDGDGKLIPRSEEFPEGEFLDASARNQQ